MTDLEVDYLVVGCGASAMAFVDVMLRETDATFVIVDRRDAPGGHWNDAYPFVRLHQPSSYYGVASRPLGRDRIETAGLNEGLYELASGTEVLAYFHDLMEADFLPTGRVTYLPMSEYREDGSVVSLISGTETKVVVRRKLVDGRRIGTQIPLTHERPFEVADGVACIPPNDLPRLAKAHSGFVILGGGKTAMDTVLWLLERGADPDAITWVRPREAWMLNRLHTQPGPEFFDETIGGFARQLKILAEAKDAAEICAAMEREGYWLRIDPDRAATLFHAATVSEREIEEMRRVGNVVRMGHVRRIEPDRLILAEGEVELPPDQLCIDCTASAAAANITDRAPIFSPGRINLQMVRPFQPTFSAALIGHIEATIEDPEEKAALTRVTPMIDTVEDWIERRFTAALNQAAWNQHDEVNGWIARCRLDLSQRTLAGIDYDDPEKAKVFALLREVTPPAIENMGRLVKELAISSA